MLKLKPDSKFVVLFVGKKMHVAALNTDGSYTIVGYVRLLRGRKKKQEE